MSVSIDTPFYDARATKEASRHNDKSVPMVVAGGVTYIADHYSGAAFAAAWDVIRDGGEFCMVHDLPAAPTSTPPVVNGAYFQTQTGGTTGAPKRIRRSHASWIKSFKEQSKTFAITHQDNYAILGRLGHSLSLYAAFEACYLGANIFFFDDMSLRDQHAWMAMSDITVLYATPTQLRLLGNDVTPSMRHIFFGGGALDHRTRTMVAQRFPNAELHEFYGASETSFITRSDATTPVGSVGRAYPNVTIEIRDPDTNGNGEIWVQSPYLFTDYANGAPQPDWASAGEIGRVDDDGYLFLAGRRDRMVTIADVNAFPETIEAAIRRHPQIKDAAVISTLNAMRGHVFHAYVVGDGIDLDDLKTDLVQEFGALIAPKTISNVSAIPTLASGKHDLRAIEKWGADHA